MPNRPNADSDVWARQVYVYDWNTYACPVCSKTSDRGRNGARFFHADGSDNTECWAAIARGDVEYPLHPVIQP